MFLGTDATGVQAVYMVIIKSAVIRFESLHLKLAACPSDHEIK
jgi:hypothetical protein